MRFSGSRQKAVLREIRTVEDPLNGQAYIKSCSLYSPKSAFQRSVYPCRYTATSIQILPARET